MTNTQAISLDAHYGIVRLAGSDAGAFLQSQLTCDVDALNQGGLMGAAWCNPKGRVVCYGYLAKQDDDFLYIIARDLVERVLKRLQMFVLRSKVTLSHDQSYRIGGILGDTSPLGNDAVCFPLPGKAARRICLEKTDTTANGNHDDPGATDRWRAARINAGEPWITAHNTETLLPEHINLDLSGAVSFEKGCFPGQEVIARMHYKGKGKTRLFVAELNVAADTDFAKVDVGSGARVTDDTGRGVGVVVESAIHSERDRIVATLTAPSHTQSDALSLHVAAIEHDQGQAEAPPAYALSAIHPAEQHK